jgi:hypothetical protein
LVEMSWKREYEACAMQGEDYRSQCYLMHSGQRDLTTQLDLMTKKLKRKDKLV